MKQYKQTPYFITEIGEVYRNDKKLKPQFTRGYLKITIYETNKRYDKMIHRLVAETYIPNPDNKPCVNHINGDKTNNRVENLEWVTNSENEIHKRDVLKKGVGEDCYLSKLTAEQVKCIRKIYNPKHKDYNTNALSQKFNMSKSQIRRIINNKAWTHIL